MSSRPGDTGAWLALWEAGERVEDRVQLLVAVSTCEQALDPALGAPAEEAKLRLRRYESVRSQWIVKLGMLTQEHFRRMLATLPLPLRPVVERWQALATALPHRSVQEDEELRAWTRVYQSEVGRLRVKADLGKRGYVEVGLGSVAALQRDVSEADRRELQTAATFARQEVEPLCCNALDALTRARCAHSQRTGVSVLQQSLLENRVSESSLSAMWGACDRVLPVFHEYLREKAAMLGKERLDWWDLIAQDAVADAAGAGPLGAETITWEQACARVIGAHQGFDAEMGAFTTRAVTSGWVHYEPLASKRSGAICVSVEGARQSRVLLSFRGAPKDVFTLAHELGHAWHADQLATVPFGAREVTRALGETASNFSEGLVREQWELPVYRAAREIESMFARVVLQRIVFDFEESLGGMGSVLSPASLNERMEAIQRRYLGDTVANYSPNNWVSMGRLFDVGGSFYNWQHCFGALFSAAMGDRLVQVPVGDRGGVFRGFLRRSGSATAEDLAREYVGVDLASSEFWDLALARVRQSLKVWKGARGVGGVRGTSVRADPWS